MAISEHLETFAGKTVYDWDAESGIQNPATSIPRIALSYEQSEAKLTWLDRFKVFLGHQHNAESAGEFTTFLADPNVAEVTGLVVGTWENSFGSENDSSLVVQSLAEAREYFPNLSALFLGDIIGEECEISWIVQSDVSALFGAFPNLQIFGVRGGNGLEFGTLQHANLKTLIVESGGMEAKTVKEVLDAELPQLEHLELWLGTDEYGGNTTISDLEPLLSGALSPNLKTLGLRDSEIADELAQACANAPIVERLHMLDLSLGTLTDAGAQALLQGSAIRHLKKLDLHHHFCSPEVVAQLEALGAEHGIEVDTSDAQVADEYDGEAYRYIAVSE